MPPDPAPEPVPVPEPTPAPQLEVTWINELRGLLSDIRQQVAELAKTKTLPSEKTDDNPKTPASSDVDVKLDEAIALLKLLSAKPSPTARMALLTRRKR